MNLSETQKKILNKIYENRFIKPYFTFLNEVDFSKKSQEYNLPEHRWMIAVSQPAPQIFVNLDKLKTDSSPMDQQLPYLLGLLTHEWAHFVGENDDAQRTLDMLAVQIMSEFQNNLSARTIQLNNGRQLQVITIRTTQNAYSHESTMIESGARLILNDGHQLHDLTSVAHQMMAQPWGRGIAKDPNGANVSLKENPATSTNPNEPIENVIGLPTLWTLKSLQPEVFVSKKNTEQEIILTYETLIKLKPLLNINSSTKDNGNSGQIDFKFDGNAKTEEENYSLRMEIKFDDSLDSPPLSIHAIDGLPRIVSGEDGMKGRSFFGGSVKPSPIGLKVTPVFKEKQIESGQTFALEFLVEIPLGQEKLVQDLVERKVFLVPAISNKPGEIGQNKSMHMIPPQRFEALEYYPPYPNQPFYRYLLQYFYTVTDETYTENYVVDKVAVVRDKISELYFMTSKPSERISVKGKYDHIKPKVDIDMVSDHKWIFKVSSDFEIDNITMFGEILYKDSFEYEWSQPFLNFFYSEGRVPQNMAELNFKLLDKTPKQLIVEMTVQQLNTSDTPFLKTYQIHHLDIVMRNRPRTKIPVNIKIKN